MSRENSNRAQPGQTRRQFLKKTGATTLAVAGAGLLHLPFQRARNKNRRLSRSSSTAPIR